MNQPSRHLATLTRVSTRTSMIALALVVLLAHVPQLISLGCRMWAQEHYSFFPLILLGGLVLAWQRYRQFVEMRTGEAWDVGFRSPLLWLASIVLLAGSVAADSPWPASVGYLLALRATVNSLCSEGLARRVMPAWWFLWLAIPLPLNLDRNLILSMQLLATKLASGVLDLYGIRHSLSGVVIELPGKSFFVEEACSGVQSLFAAISVTVFYSMLGRRGLLRTILLSLCAVGWVLAANALRIILVTVLSTRYQIPIDVGWAHEATGVVVFVLAMLMIVSTDRCLLFLAPLKKKGAFETEKSSTSKSRRRLRRWSLSPVWTVPTGILVAAVCGVLGFVQLTHALTSKPESFILERGEERVSQSTLPEEWNGWKQEAFTIVERKFNDPNGQISRVWRYERSGQVVLFSLDGPFSGWHDLGLCYISQDWTVAEEEDHILPTDAGLRYDYSELSQENAQGRHAYVAFTAFDEGGERVSPPPFFRVGVGMRFPNAAMAIKRFADRLTLSKTDVPQYGGMVYQSQAFVESQSLLTDAEQALVVELFQHLTSELRSEFQQHRSVTAGEGED